MVVYLFKKDMVFELKKTLLEVKVEESRDVGARKTL